MRRFAIVFVAVVVLLCVMSARGRAVSTCGAVVNGPDQLTGDLDCSAFNGPAVQIDRGTLSLGGFTITGHPAHPVVSCTRNCKIVGPGTLTGGRDGIRAVEVKVRVTDVTISGNSGLGITARVVVTKGCTVSGNGSVNDPDVFVHTGGVHGIRKVLARDCTIQNNLNFGITTATAVLSGSSSVIDNGTNPDCVASLSAISLGCADLAISDFLRRPILSASSVCETSQKLYTFLGDNWGVCLND